MRRSGSTRPGVVVSCRGGRHRVRLAGGVRFWQSAHCPICRAPVDPSRVHRTLAWLGALARPRSAGALDRSLHAVSLAYPVVILALVGILWGLADRWWLATTLLFGPRWIVLPPGLVLAGVVLVRDPRLLWPVGLGLILAAGPLVEVRTGWRALVAPDPAPGDLTVVTYNVAGGDRVTHSAERMLERWDADVLLVQECGGRFRDALVASVDEEALWGGNESTLCILSRHPIIDVQSMDAQSLQVAGGSGRVVTWHLQTASDLVAVTNLHLETPRDGFELLRSGAVLRAIPVMRDKSRLREIELRHARRWVDSLSTIPRVVAGDFNTPPESRFYRDHWGDWTNAWGHLGHGHGGTRLNGWIRPRIDHILVDSNWAVIDAALEDDLGSDHLPVRAVIRLRRDPESDPRE